MSFIPEYEFDKRVIKYKGNYRIRHFSCWDQFLSMSFAQSTYRESLQDIEACLNAQPNKLYHMGSRVMLHIRTLLMLIGKEIGIFMLNLLRC